ncbi:MarR family winged helix-turn-helix transcriptional regulator [Agromyces salentinus]|uniref:MarR family winged helix-turn-helix transcriptional regulator n=1 Tax=Agromyces salentinus TaxID=269421 RepID=A0ABP4Z109_9MICO|nr:MarR family winged helix-turn-helix transcriptional regulator [Agromyces salentinus]
MKPPQVREGDPPFQDLILSVFHLSNVLSVAGDQLVADLGLTSARWQVLGALAVTPAQPVAWIARDLQSTRQNIQRIVNDLERAGFVALRPNPHHKRAQLVEMTPEGHRVFELAASRGGPWAQHAAAGLSQDDVDVVRQVLHAIGTAVENYDYPSLPENPA